MKIFAELTNSDTDLKSSALRTTWTLSDSESRHLDLDLRDL